MPASQICQRQAVKCFLKSESFQLNKEKKPNAEVAKICNKNESSINEIKKKGKKIYASFAGTSQTAKVGYHGV